MPQLLSSSKRRTLRSLLAMPPAAIRRMAGAPVELDGNVLDAEMQLVLALQRFEGKAIEDRPLPSARRALVAGARLVGGRLPIGAVTDRDIDGPAGRLRLRFYTPRGLTQTSGALVFMHGGGWIYGDLESHDAMCRFLAEKSGVRVVAIDYRLAPEAPFPAATEDVWAAYQWVLAHAEGLGIDPNRVAVGGDSAGGNLAAVLAQQAVREGLSPAYQLLIYPGVDFAEHRPSGTLFEEGFFLTRKFMDGAREHYIGDFEDLKDPRLSPLYGDLIGLPPAYVVTAGFDPLRDEGEAYADAMRAAGVEVEYACERGLIHSFANMVAVGRSGPAAMGRAAQALRQAIG